MRGLDGMLRDQAIQVTERLLRLAERFPAARELVEHDVGTRIVGFLLEEPRVDVDRLAGLGLALPGLLAARGVPGLELQVAESAHGLGTELGVTAFEFEEIAIQRLGALWVGSDGLVGADLGRGALQVLERRRRRGRLAGRSRERHQD